MRNDLLLALRTQRGWTQEELSERSGISVRTIRNLERGRVRSPRRSSLDLLFSVLDPETRGRGGAGRVGAAPVAGVSPAGGPLATVPPRAAETPAGMAAFAAGPRPKAVSPVVRWRGPRPPRTALVGREGDLDRLCAIVTAHPVTVLTGPGGIGKTRLALAVAERTAARFPGGIGVVQLGRIAPDGEPCLYGAPDTDPVPAGCVRPGPSGCEGPGALTAAWQAVGDVLDDAGERPAGRAGLLVLDTAEHLPQTTALIVERLRGAWPDLRIVITTRRPPVLAEARIWETGPLSPDCAVELMFRRLASSSLTDDLTKSPDRVRELCRELDCVPRLIEFAAYWLRSVPVAALLRPEHVLELLGVPDVAALPHQRSMRGSLEWSWGMLTARQRQFMARLAERPEPVTSDVLEVTLLERDFTSTEAVCLLAELADVSLLQVSRGTRYEYRMLQHVRAFVGQRTRPAAEVPRARTVRAAAGA